MTYSTTAQVPRDDLHFNTLTKQYLNPLTPLPAPSPFPPPPFSGKCGVFGRRFRPKPKFPADENSSGRNLRTKIPQAEASGKCSSFFLPLPYITILSSPPLQIKLGGPSTIKLLRDSIVLHALLYHISHVTSAVSGSAPVDKDSYLEM